MRTLSATLTTEMDGLDRTPASRVTVERWLPEWTARISGLSGGQTEQYAHGHSVATAEVGATPGTAGFFSALLFDLANGPAITTETVICRARSGSYSNPADSKLYIAVITGANLIAPATWESLWVDTGITGLMAPAWTANSGASHGGSIAVVNSGNNFRVFYLLATGDLRYVDVSYTGAVGTPVTIANVGTGVQLASMQLASCNATEVFVLLTQEVEASQAGWQPAVYGSFIRRYGYSGSWSAGNTFHFLTHAEGGLCRDSLLKGSDFGDTSASTLTAQWGKRFCGGLGACEIDSNTVLVNLGMTFWRRWGYNTHNQGIVSFVYHRDSGWWGRGPETDGSDFSEATRLQVSSFARACKVEGANFWVWNRSTEPSDYDQLAASLALPRITETVYAKVSSDGKSLTQFQYLGSQDNLTAASIIVVNHSGTKTLFALGWRSVYESPPAGLICSVTSPQDLADYAESWRLSRNNRRTMGLDIRLADPAILLDPASVVKGGALARAYYGTPTELVQAGQGFIDLNSPSLRADADGKFSEEAALNCRAEDLLLNTRAESIEDVLSQNTMLIPPSDPINHVALSKGYWTVAPMTWPTTFFSGSYDGLQNQPAWRLWSFPYANTGGAGGVGDPGKILSERPNMKGSWFKDITWLAMPPMTDGAIEASVRWGDLYNQGQFTFKAADGNQIYVTLSRTNGVITQMQWRTGGYSGTIFNTVRLSACMAGLICHAPEVGRKYAFVWEHQSDFSLSSHTDDTWTKETFDRADYSSHGTGSNRLYLIMSDYNSSTNWVNKSVVGGITATGLTVGHPADLRMQVIGGTIYCFYRSHSTGTPNQWRFAFSYRAGRFGAGRFGLVGRGHAGIQWDVMYPGRAIIQKCENHVDFWNIKLSDAQPDQTLEEHLRRMCWRGFTTTEFSSKVSEASRTVNSGVNYSYGEAVENLTIDFKVSIPTGGEAGVFVRGVSAGSPADTCVKLGLVPGSTGNAATNEVAYYLVKRRFSGGSEVTGARAYAPLPLQLSPNSSVPVRVSVRGPVYSLWIAGNYAGHFVDQTELGLYFGLYATGAGASFSNIYVPELYEVPASGLIEVNQAMADALSKVIGNRRVKGFFTHDGKLKFSYFATHAAGPDFHENRLFQSAIQRNPRYLSKVRVQGSDAYAVYQSATLAARGQRFQVIKNTDITLREFAYKEAVQIVTETAERQLQATFEGAPDLRVEPEDQIEVTVSRQNVAGDFIVDDIEIGFKLGEEPDSKMRVSTRQTVAL